MEHDTLHRGAATEAAVAYRMLTQAGLRDGDGALGLTASTFATTLTLLAMPLLALHAIIAGVAAPRGLVEAAWVNIVWPGRRHERASGAPGAIALATGRQRVSRH